MEKTDLRETVSFKAAVLVILAAAVVFAFILGNVVGTMDISVSDIIDTVSGNHTGTNNKVIWNIRLPRMILAALVGINLALSGSILQGVMKNPLAVGSIIVLIVIIAMILIVPHVVPYKYSQIITVNGSRDKAAGNMAPFTYSEKELAYMAEGGEVFPHIMGTDSMGRDYFIRVIYGTRVSLTVGLFAAVIVLLIGVVYGSISGYFGGKVDMVMMRIVDIIYSLPDMLMVVLLSVVLREVINVDAFPALQKIGTNMISMFIVFALLYWTGMARMVRGQILTVKQNEYILAARVSGAKDSRIIRRHILPNIVSVIIIAAALQIPSAIFTESFLSFIGLGVQAPMPSLGSLANEARAGITQYPYKLLFPAGMICLITLAFNLLGDGLRDAFDPKLRR